MKKYTVDVDEELWGRFKWSIRKDKTINEAMVELIEEKVKREEGKRSIRKDRISEAIVELIEEKVKKEEG